MQTRIFVRVAAACLALAACESSTGSARLEGVYLLRTVEGRPVPAVLDSLPWNDGVTYSIQRLVAGSVEFRGRDTAVYTRRTRHVTFHAGMDSLWSESCLSAPVPYRVQGDRLLLVIEPALMGQTGRLRLDTLQAGDETLVHQTRTPQGRPLRLEYATASQPAQCQ